MKTKTNFMTWAEFRELAHADWFDIDFKLVPEEFKYAIACYTKGASAPIVVFSKLEPRLVSRTPKDEPPQIKEWFIDSDDSADVLEGPILDINKGARLLVDKCFIKREY